MVEIFQPKNSSVGKWLHALPAAALLVVVGLETATPDIRVTPSLMTIALGGLSLVLPPRVLAAWAAILFLPVLGSLLFIPVNGAPEAPAVIILRGIAYVFVAVMAYALSRHRVTRERQLNNLLALFDSLGAPIMVSDGDGVINFANRACCTLLGHPLQEVREMSFFTLFAQPERRGKAIEHYLDLLASDPGTSADMMLATRNSGRDAVFSARCSVFQMDGRRLLISQLEAGEK